MNRYRIKLNGHTYEMDVELISSDTPAPAAPAVKKSAPAPAPAPAPAAAVSVPARAPTTSAGCRVCSPMPGMIVKINAAVGDSVRAGQAVVILEAMKMDNEITAPKAGILQQLAVTEGQQVANGELLFEIV